ncbi:hypothetical protein GRF59_08250 [Paenibacillus sp. HJL G12]|uniref:Zinc ribbon domain-containing protein n=1 Tax=Paenibacillus dendrobii TaxID=2691084 RepID=A0A7X3LGW0_9BACL|nr:hypothetical protein [Paenibacillus dendrobii]MWV43625.1 hypothetical protein [Paenibacillus dendrobii]
MPVKICPACGESNPVAAGSCRMCGASLEKAKAVRSLKTAPRQEVTNGDRTDTSHTLHTRHAPPGSSSAVLSGSGWLMVMLVIATIIYPFVGMIVGGVTALRDDRDKRENGAFLLLISLIIWAIRMVLQRWLFN